MTKGANVIGSRDASVSDRRYEALLGLAGVEAERPQVARCLLIDPPRRLVDLLSGWTVSAIGRGIRASALSHAVNIRLSEIELVRSERDRLALEFVSGGLGLADAMAIADNWVDFGPRSDPPSREFQSALLFEGSGEGAFELTELVLSGRIRKVIYVGDAPWTITARGADDRADLAELLTLQAFWTHGDGTEPGSSQLLMFESGRNRPDRVQLSVSAQDRADRWPELVWWDNERRTLGVRGGSREAPRLRSWRAVSLPRTIGFAGAPWHPVLPADAAMLRRIDRHYPRLQPEDVSVGANRRVDPFWQISDSRGFQPTETVPYASLKNLRGGSAAGEPMERVVWTRDRHGKPRRLEDLSEPLRGWIHDRVARFASRFGGGVAPDAAEPWWTSPWSDLPQKSFVALPVISEFGLPTVFEAGTLTSPGLLWFEPHRLDVEAVAALLTAGPAHDQLRTMSAIGQNGNRVLTLEALTAVRLPRRIHPLIQDDLCEAYRTSNLDAMEQLAKEVYTGNERSLLRRRVSTTPSLFD